MSRPRLRRKRPPAGLPPQLVQFRFEHWHDTAWDVDYEPGGYFQHYLARAEWQEARRRWMDGEDLPLLLESPRPVLRASTYTDSVPAGAPEGAPPQARATD